ncbi:hypothetical protein VitviT2T_022328 [Vitis vinifera]|uniref:Uncharacterized protein n=1 Tax=Vitis vinifera TaxID=29760 RepID=A0ABY9DBT6_VITVI|nr:hypothetical protein VitviT2T_022328 [Vitis vinifera]
MPIPCLYSPMYVHQTRSLTSSYHLHAHHAIILIYHSTTTPIPILPNIHTHCQLPTLLSSSSSLLHTPSFQYPPCTPFLPPLHGPQDLWQNPPSSILPVGLSLSSYPLKLSHSSPFAFPITTTSMHTYLISLTSPLMIIPISLRQFLPLQATKYPHHAPSLLSACSSPCPLPSLNHPMFIHHLSSLQPPPPFPTYMHGNMHLRLPIIPNPVPRQLPKPFHSITFSPSCLSPPFGHYQPAYHQDKDDPSLECRRRHQLEDGAPRVYWDGSLRSLRLLPPGIRFCHRRHRHQ